MKNHKGEIIICTKDFFEICKYNVNGECKKTGGCVYRKKDYREITMFEPLIKEKRTDITKSFLMDADYIFDDILPYKSA